MSQTKITDEQIKEELLLGLNSVQIARKYSMDDGGLRKRIRRLAQQGFSPKHDFTKMVPDGYFVKGTSTQYDGEGNIRQQWVKSAIDAEQQMKLFKEALEAFKEDLPKVLPRTIYNEHLIDEELMAVYPLGDPHISMLAWEDECGHNWDLKIAEEIFCSVFDRVVKVAPPCKQAVIVNLGDYFHRDNMEGTTSRSGNHLDVDGRYAKMVRVGVKIIRQMIESALDRHETVRVINAVGNHDDTGALFLSVCLAHIYENEPRVLVDISPAPFHYVRFGKTLIGVHHGHTCKIDKLPGVMATDKPKDWGETEHRYWLTGHLHHSRLQEYPGVTVEVFRTLAPNDAYATWGGYRSKQDTRCLVMHKEFGQVETHIVNIARGLYEYKTNK